MKKIAYNLFEERRVQNKHGLKDRFGRFDTNLFCFKTRLGEKQFELKMVQRNEIHLHMTREVILKRCMLKEIKIRSWGKVVFFLVALVSLPNVLLNNLYSCASRQNNIRLPLASIFV